MHAECLVIADKNGHNEWSNHLLSRMYKTQLPNRPGHAAQPNVREVRVIDVLIEKDFMRNVLYDLSPYSHGRSFAKSMARTGFALLGKTLGLKPVPFKIDKRQVRNPDWRDYINLEVVGVKKEGDNARIVFCMQAQRKYLDEFESFLLTRKYVVTDKEFVKPSVREVRWYDVSNFESCMGAMFNDIRPFFSVDDRLPKWIVPFVRFARKMLKMKNPPASTEKPVTKIPWMKDVEMTVLTMKPDRWHRCPDTGAWIEELI